MDISLDKTIDRQKLADAIHTILDAGVAMLQQEKFTPQDRDKLRVMRALGSHVSSGVAMIQQENFQIKAALIQQRMTQLGYDDGPMKLA